MTDPVKDSVNAERRKLVETLHDGLSQRLMGAAMLSHVLLERMVQEGNACAQDMAQLNQYLNQASEDLKDLYKSLEPSL